jgi:hypothetical protein
MFENIIRSGVCGVALLLAGCGAQDTVRDQVSAIVSDDAVVGVPGCPGTWQLPETYEGLVGQYLRNDLSALEEDDLLTLGIVTLAHEPRSIRDEGNYLASLFGAATQGGTYAAVEANPLIGSLLILEPAPRSAPQTVYAVIGLRRDVVGNVAALCLAGSTRPFQLNRIGL